MENIRLANDVAGYNPASLSKPINMRGDKMKEIVMKDTSVILIDDCDYVLLVSNKWHKLTVGNCNYAATYIVLPDGSRKQELMHRIILKPFKGWEVDHIDGNGLNNQRGNLRICKHRNNQMNRRKHIIGTSQYKGVSWDKDKQRWRASISVNGKRRRLGSYKKEKDAASAYNKAAKLIYGEYANLNNIY